MGHGHGAANEDGLSHEEMAGNGETNREKKRCKKNCKMSRERNSEIQGCYLGNERDGA